jgi:hypothetical protein
MRAFLLGCFAVGVFALCPRQANAEDKGQGACKDDIAKFCKGQKGQALGACLHQHESELSDACKTHIAAMKGKMQDVMTACQSDVDKFCAGMKPGSGEIRKCLHDHAKDVSDGCKTAMHAAQEHTKTK